MATTTCKSTLCLTSSPSWTELRLKETGQANFRLDVLLEETDPFLANKLVSLEITWGDGSLPLQVPATNSPLVDVYGHTYLQQGLYVVKLRAHNFRVPNNDTVQQLYQLSVLGEPLPVTSKGVVFGPILPRDNGFPNPQQWVFDVGKDLVVLESSIRSLLSTNKGERLMEPEWGTNLRRFIFHPDPDVAADLVRTEIADATVQNEPRVELLDVQINIVGNKADVQASFRSKLSNQAFQVNLSLDK